MRLLAPTQFLAPLDPDQRSTPRDVTQRDETRPCAENSRPYRRSAMRRPISAERMSSIDAMNTTEDTAISWGNRLGTRSWRTDRPARSARTGRNDAIAYSSNESVKAMRNAETSAGVSSGNVTRRN